VFGGGWYNKRTRGLENLGMAAECKLKLTLFAFGGLKYSKNISPFRLFSGAKSL